MRPRAVPGEQEEHGAHFRSQPSSPELVLVRRHVGPCRAQWDEEAGGGKGFLLSTHERLPREHPWLDTGQGQKAKEGCGRGWGLRAPLHVKLSKCDEHEAYDGSQSHSPLPPL